MTRRGFFVACGAALSWLGLGKTLSGCSGDVAYEVRVSSLDNGASVYQATSRNYELRVDTRVWRGFRKVVSVNGMRSDSWIFEIDGQEFLGNADSAVSTRVRTDQVITWRTV